MKISDKITLNKLNKLNKDTRYAIYFLIIIVFGIYLIFKPPELIMSVLVKLSLGVLFIYLGIVWGIRSKYIPGNWKGSNIMLPSNGIKGKPAQIIGYILSFIGFSLIVWVLFLNYRI